MASLKTISLPHGAIPTQMFGNVNLQNAVMYINENFTEMKSGVNEMISSANDALDAKAEADHDHDESYAALSHTHGMDEIVGLNAKLDDKAALNHEHSQYLSSLPAHYHDTTQVSGLDNQLHGKADSVHGHSISQVDGLLTELGVKASTAYVDQQIAQLGGKVKDTMRNAADMNPVATKGTSVHGEYPALADFYDYPDKAAHPTDPAIVFPEWQVNLSGVLDNPDHAPPARMTGADDTTPVGWERGKTAWKNGHDVDELHPAVGCSMTVCTHMRTFDVGGGILKKQCIFSRMDFDENGLLVRVVPCSNWFTLV